MRHTKRVNGNCSQQDTQTPSSLALRESLNKFIRLAFDPDFDKSRAAMASIRHFVNTKDLSFLYKTHHDEKIPALTVLFEEIFQQYANDHDAYFNMYNAICGLLVNWLIGKETAQKLIEHILVHRTEDGFFLLLFANAIDSDFLQPWIDDTSRSEDTALDQLRWQAKLGMHRGKTLLWVISLPPSRNDDTETQVLSKTWQKYHKQLTMADFRATAEAGVNQGKSVLLQMAVNAFFNNGLAFFGFWRKFKGEITIADCRVAANHTKVKGQTLLCLLAYISFTSQYSFIRDIWPQIKDHIVLSDLQQTFMPFAKEITVFWLLGQLCAKDNPDPFFDCCDKFLKDLPTADLERCKFNRNIRHLVPENTRSILAILIRMRRQSAQEETEIFAVCENPRIPIDGEHSEQVVKMLASNVTRRYEKALVDILSRPDIKGNEQDFGIDPNDRFESKLRILLERQRAVMSHTNAPVTTSAELAQAALQQEAALKKLRQVLNALTLDKSLPSSHASSAVTSGHTSPSSYFSAYDNIPSSRGSTSPPPLEKHDEAGNWSSVRPDT